HAEVIGSVRSRNQETCGLEIYQESMYRAHRQAAAFGDLRGGESTLGTREKLQQAKPPLQCRDVIGSFAGSHHRASPIGFAEMKVQIIRWKLILCKPISYKRPNCLTASWIDFNFSMTGYIECSLKSICWARLRTSCARARGTTATPSLSATTMSPGFTGTPSQIRGICAPSKR